MHSDTCVGEKISLQIVMDGCGEQLGSAASMFVFYSSTEHRDLLRAFTL